MVKRILISGALIVLSASWASAAPGTRIQWDGCDGPDNKTSTCLSNFEPDKRLWGTFELPPPGATVVGNEITLDASDPSGAPLTCWWNMIPTNAPRAAGFDMIFTTPLNCPDYWGSVPGGPSGGASATSSGTRLRIVGVVAISELGAQHVGYGVAFYSFTWRLKFANTTTVTCPGCNTPNMQLDLQNITVTQPTGMPSISLGPDPTDPTPCVKFQGTVTACDGATPVPNSTWGRIKSLYR